MATLNIVLWDDPILSKVCNKVEDNEFGPELELFAGQLLATMATHEGLGLAAPQVGVAKRMFAMQFPRNGKEPIVACNPELDLRGSTTYALEGCLSLPSVYEQVSRAEEVWMQYCTPAGERVEMLLASMDARIAQHESDHINGIMFFDFKDKRDSFLDASGQPLYGARMSKQLSKQVLRKWEKARGK
jgi:peptide deformylase